ncbi:MAG: hypothetical protein LBH08_00900 [Puniceicoccales bacterium]|jgi:hypothetical protein|nr:hypothetical protein [Puniceicoccales bacterium]
MKKYSLLIVLGCLEGSLFASEVLKPALLQESMLAKPEDDRFFNKLNAFLQSLEICKTALTTLVFDDIDPEILVEFQEYIDSITTHIDNIQEKVASIMPYLQQAEHMSNLQTGTHFQSINFDAILDDFIRIENEALRWLKKQENNLSKESYKRIKCILKISMAAALAQKFATIAGKEAYAFSCGCCDML